MQTNLKIKIYLCSTILLFFILFTLEETLKVPFTPLEKISLKDINNVIKTKGILTSQSIIKNHSFLTFSTNTTPIEGIFFEYNKSLEKKEYIILGKVTPYQNKAQLIIYQLKLPHQ